MCTIFLSKNRKNEDHFGYIGVDGRASYVGVKWITLAQDKHQWQSLVNTVTNIGTAHEMGNFVNSCVISTAYIIENVSTPYLIGYVNACCASNPSPLDLIN
jgi:hypothetical protein